MPRSKAYLTPKVAATAPDRGPAPHVPIATDPVEPPVWAARPRSEKIVLMTTLRGKVTPPRRGLPARASVRPARSSRRPSEPIDASDLNVSADVDPERALAAADHADVNLPFGGVPAGIKELDAVAGWPDTDASLVFKDRIATTTSPNVERLRERRRRRARRSDDGQ